MHPRTDTVSDAECIAVAASDTIAVDDRLTKRANDDRIAKRSSVLIAARTDTTIGVGSACDTSTVTDEIGPAATMKS
jgi:hypothetical protein